MIRLLIHFSDIFITPVLTVPTENDFSSSTNLKSPLSLISVIAGVCRELIWRMVNPVICQAKAE
jgi:hypothetical protein